MSYRQEKYNRLRAEREALWATDNKAAAMTAETLPFPVRRPRSRQYHDEAPRRMLAADAAREAEAPAPR